MDVFFKLICILHWHRSSINCWLQLPYSMWIYFCNLKPILLFAISKTITGSIIGPLNRWTSNSTQRGFSAYFGVGDCHSVSHSLGRDLSWYRGGDAIWDPKQFSGRPMTISLQDWKIWFRTYIKEPGNFDLGRVLMTYMGLNLPQHLEHKAF